MRVDFRDAKRGAGGSIRVAVTLLPVLQRVGADAGERGELRLSKAGFFLG
jgi:hypothetical protein